jgi:hypothetical protein
MSMQKSGEIAAPAKVAPPTVESVASVSQKLRQIVTLLASAEINLQRIESKVQFLQAKLIAGPIQIVRETRQTTAQEKGAEQQLKNELAQLQGEQKALQAEQTKLSGGLAGLAQVVGPMWWPYMYPPINVSLQTPHARYVAKYVPLSVAIGLLKGSSAEGKSVGQPFGVDLKQSFDRINKIQTELEFVQNLQDVDAEKRTNIFREDYYSDDEATRSNARTEVAVIDERLHSWVSNITRLQREIDTLVSPVVYVVRNLLGPRMPPLDQLRIVTVWCEKDAGKPFYLSLDPQKGESNFWYNLTVASYFGQWISAVVIAPKGSDESYRETIYPLQSSIFDSLQTERFNDPVFERAARRLPQENPLPNLWAMLTLISESRHLHCLTQSSQLRFVRLSASKFPDAERKALVTGAVLEGGASFSYLPDLEFILSRHSHESPLSEAMEEKTESPSSAIGLLRLILPNISIVNFKRLDFAVDEEFADRNHFVKFNPRQNSWDLLSLSKTPLELGDREPKSVLQSLPSATFPTVLASQRNTQHYLAISVAWLRVPNIVPPLWVANRAYEAKEIVMFKSDMYVALANNTNQKPSAKSPWQLKAIEHFVVLPVVIQASNGEGLYISVMRPKYSAPSRYSCLLWSLHNNSSLSFQEKTAVKKKGWRDLMDAGATAASTSPATNWSSNAHYVSAEGGCSILASGAVIVNTHKLLSDVFNVDFMKLQDLATAPACPLGGREILLRVTTTIKEGAPWYSRFGLIPVEGAEGIEFINTFLAVVPFHELREFVAKTFESVGKTDSGAPVLEALGCGLPPKAGSVISLRQMIGTTISNTCNSIAFLLQSFGDLPFFDTFLNNVKTHYAKMFDDARKRPGLTDQEFKAALDVWQQRNSLINRFEENDREISRFFRSVTRDMLWVRRPSILFPTPPPAPLPIQSSVTLNPPQFSMPITLSPALPPPLPIPILPPPLPVAAATLRFGGNAIPTYPTIRKGLPRLHVRLKNQ